MAQQAARAVDWCALPPEVLALCLSEEKHKHAALATHSSWAHAVVHDGVTTLRLDVARKAAFAPSVRVLHKLWGQAPASASPPPGAWSSGQQAAKAKGATLVLHGEESDEKGTKRCLAELQACGVHLAFIATLRLQVRTLASAAAGSLQTMHRSGRLACHSLASCRLQSLQLDARMLRDMSKLLPNLQQLQLIECTTADGCLLSVFSSLQSLEVSGEGIKASHLSSLAALPRLSSISLGHDSECSGVLTSLGSQLTALELESDLRQCLDGTQRPAPAWRATLEHVTRCAQLRSLTIPCVTSEELTLVAPALAQLRDLHLCGWLGGCSRVDGDAVVEALLRLPHLTSLRWDRASRYTLQRSYTKDPCRWKQIAIESITPQLLARLPLHSLTAPLAWEDLVIDGSTSVADVEAAAAAAARCPGGVAWRPGYHNFPCRLWFEGPRWADGSEHFFGDEDEYDDALPFEHGATEADTPAALLRALRPLLAAVSPGRPGKAARMQVENAAWDVEAVRALGAALPATCTELVISNGRLPLLALVEVVHSLPQLEQLDICGVEVEPSSVWSYVTVVGALRRALGASGGGPRLRRLRVDVPEDAWWSEGLNVEGPVSSWKRMKKQAKGLANGVELVVRRM